VRAGNKAQSVRAGNKAQSVRAGNKALKKPLIERRSPPGFLLEMVYTDIAMRTNIQTTPATARCESIIIIIVSSAATPLPDCVVDGGQLAIRLGNMKKYGKKYGNSQLQNYHQITAEGVEDLRGGVEEKEG